jgi:periplasmic protein TonB
MPAMELAMASRQSAILALVGGLHVGAFVLAAGGLLPRLLDALPQSSVITVLPRAAEPEVRLRPALPRPADYAPLQAPLPDIEIPRDIAAMRPPAAASVSPGAPADDPSDGPQGLREPPALRTRDSRVVTLIDACYPASARRLGEEGRAVAIVVVDPRGDVVRWSLSQGSGFPRLDGALGCVIRRLEFDPGRRDGVAVTSEALLPVAFRLN